MKSLVVLLILAASAITAPAPLEHALKGITPSSSEEKSTQELREKISTTNEVALADADSDPASASRRTVIIQKPIIVNKKIGYHLYRNSEEEQKYTGSREGCMEGVKVKLCNEKMLPESVVRSSMPEDMTDEEMKRSIMMVKEAVNILQTDLKRLEEKSKGNFRQESETDNLIYEDIKIATQAIQHAHKTFNDLESTSTSKKVDLQPNQNFSETRSEAQKLAQWKDAMHNIQKNMEIAKNIEDSFIFPSDNVVSNVNGMNPGLNSKDSEDNVNFDISDMKPERQMLSNVDKNHDNTLESLMKNQEMLKETEDQTKNDAEGSLTSMMELKPEDIEDLDYEDTEKQNVELNQRAPDEKSADSELFNLNMMDADVGASSQDIKFLDPNFMQQISGGENNQESDSNRFGQHNDIKEWIKLASKKDRFTMDIEEGLESMKPVKTIAQYQGELEQSKIKSKQSNSEKTLEKFLNKQIGEDAQRSHLMYFNDADSSRPRWKFSSELSSVPMEARLDNKKTEEANKMRWAHNMERDTSFENQKRISQFILPDMDMPSPDGHVTSQRFRMSDIMGESPDWEMQQSHPMSMRDDKEVEPNHLLDWKPTHDSSTRFGTPITPVNPVGIYPNANDCSIPLLVSCAPSVVSGTLSNPHHYSWNGVGLTIKGPDTTDSAHLTNNGILQPLAFGYIPTSIID